MIFPLYARNKSSYSLTHYSRQVCSQSMIDWTRQASNTEGGWKTEVQDGTADARTHSHTLTNRQMQTHTHKRTHAHYAVKVSILGGEGKFERRTDY